MIDRFSRQSFLGKDSQEKIENCRIGIAGLGGGGSHIVQQTAHVGFLKYALYDGDVTKDLNLNRDVGATLLDAVDAVPKLEVAKRLILGLSPNAEIEAFKGRWQENPAALKNCDIVFGCVDGFSERDQLERCARRYMIPYIDIGMDVHRSSDPVPMMAGQVILSMPGGPCMRCLGFLTEERLAREAAKYGAAGPRPQVVWPNGVLASTAVGLALDLITDWTRSLRKVAYFSYRGNDGTVQPHVRLRYLPSETCSHYPLSEIGDPVFKTL